MRSGRGHINILMARGVVTLKVIEEIQKVGTVFSTDGPRPTKETPAQHFAADSMLPATWERLGKPPPAFGGAFILDKIRSHYPDLLVQGSLCITTTHHHQ